ncbi:Transcription_termination factor Rho [Hexamita inflata]|uniref:Transcription termination factor Rho n=1 Tax=Hexamita inflata TaxID=28002 RepID=A0AA86PWQ9_9EUKA|nr:Transcription termination factor Rho [Hexamita inflata]
MQDQQISETPFGVTQEFRSNMVVVRPVSATMTEDVLRNCFTNYGAIKMVRISPGKNETQQPEGQVYFENQLDLVKFIASHTDLRFEQPDGVNSVIRLPKQEKSCLVLNRIPLSTTSAQLQSILIPFLEEKTGRQIAVTPAVFEATRGSQCTATLQFALEKDMEEAYKYLLEDEFTLRVGRLLNGEDSKLVSLEETSRRHEFKETIVNKGEILKIPVSRYNPNQKLESQKRYNQDRPQFDNRRDQYEQRGGYEQRGNYEQRNGGYEQRSGGYDQRNGYEQRQGYEPRQNSYQPNQGQGYQQNYSQGSYQGQQQFQKPAGYQQSYQPQSYQPASNTTGQPVTTNYFQPSAAYGQQTTQPQASAYGQPSYADPNSYQQYGSSYQTKPNDYQQKPFQREYQPRDSYQQRELGQREEIDYSKGRLSAVSVYLTNVPKQADERDISEALSRFKQPTRIKDLPTNHPSFKSVIVYFDDEQAVKSALSCRDPIRCQNETIIIKEHYQTRKL